MTTATRYWTVTGITSVGIAVGMGLMFVAVSKLSITLGAVATSIVVASAAVAIPSTLAAQRYDARAERDAEGSSADGPPARTGTQQ